MKAVAARLGGLVLAFLLAAGASSAHADKLTPAEVTLPRVDPQVSSGVIPFGDMKLQLELGRWTVAQLDQLLGRAQTEFPDANTRLAFLLEQLRRTPFEYEAQLAIPPPGTLRVRMQSFGCTGLAIYLLALNSAGSFAEFAIALRKLRYWQSVTRGLDSDPVRGNILDFAEDIFLVNARAQGFLTDVTREVAGKTPLETFRSQTIARRRNAEEDPARHRILPKLHSEKVQTLQMISSAAFARMDRSRIRTGDILLFSRIPPGSPASRELMFGHATIALNRDGEIYMMHATRDYVWRPEAKLGDKPIAAGVYYLDDPRREQLGVGAATEWVRDPEGRHIRISGKSYYGYKPDRLRPVYDYLGGAHIQGITVLRPTNLTAEARVELRRLTTPEPAQAEAAARPLPDPPRAADEVLVDSQMTHAEAVLTNLPKDCPVEIARRQQLVEVSYYARDGRLHRGQLVVDSALAEDIRAVFQVIRATRFPVESVIPIAHSTFLRSGRWDDGKSMDANNTSGFNYRNQTGSRKLSAHSFGFAVDLNPAQNPYIKGRGARQVVLPSGAVHDRSVPGALTADHPVTRKFKELGWKWGGEFRTLKDFQHFEKDPGTLRGGLSFRN